MKLEDPNLPKPASDWALIGADRIHAWGVILQHNPEANPIGELAQAMLSIVEAQSRIIGDLAARIDALEASALVPLELERMASSSNSSTHDALGVPLRR